MICRHKRGNKSTYTCPFHGWTFSNTGKLLKAKDPDGAGYPESFNKNGSHDLQKVARFANYRGFLFGSLNPDVKSIEEHLGESRKIIDLIVDQSPEGLEVLRGNSQYIYDGNWKLQAENGADGYHVSSVHWNYAATTQARKAANAKDDIRAMDAGGWAKKGGGFYSYEHGHLLLWTNWSNPQDRPNWDRREELTAQYGQARADWMIEKSRNLCLYPNVFLMDQFSSQIRMYRPISVDKTEVTIYCIAPKGESAEARAHRIRQYEDFFNASGMATPDDLEEFRSCQIGYGARHAQWNDLSRGATHWIEGADEDAKAIDMKPLLSGARTEDEGLFVIQHAYWRDALIDGLRRTRKPLPGWPRNSIQSDAAAARGRSSHPTTHRFDTKRGQPCPLRFNPSQWSAPPRSTRSRPSFTPRPARSMIASGMPGSPATRLRPRFTCRPGTTTTC